MCFLIISSKSNRKYLYLKNLYYFDILKIFASKECKVIFESLSFLEIEKLLSILL